MRVLRLVYGYQQSFKTVVKIISWYLQGTKDRGLVFNPSKKLVVMLIQIFGTMGPENPQDPIFSRSSNIFVVNFSNCLLLWVSTI